MERKEKPVEPPSREHFGGIKLPTLDIQKRPLLKQFKMPPKLLINKRPPSDSSGEGNTVITNSEKENRRSAPPTKPRERNLMPSHCCLLFTYISKLLSLQKQKRRRKLKKKRGVKSAQFSKSFKS